MTRLFLRALTVLVALPLVYFLLALLGALWPGPHADLDGAARHRVGLARGPIHYDLLLPLTPDSRRRFAFAGAQGVPLSHPEADWLIVGWGAEQFYTGTGSLADMAAGPVWRAISGDRAVIRLDVAGSVGDQPWLHWVFLNDAQLEALTRAIETSLSRDAGGQPIPLPGLHPATHDAFFRAEGRFDLRRTCNQWIGETLRAAGLPFGRWTPTPQAVSLSLWWNGL